MSNHVIDIYDYLIPQNRFKLRESLENIKNIRGGGLLPYSFQQHNDPPASSSSCKCQTDSVIS